jgi:hypothetical protein
VGEGGHVFSSNLSKFVFTSLWRSQSSLASVGFVTWEIIQCYFVHHTSFNQLKMLNTTLSFPCLIPQQIFLMSRIELIYSLGKKQSYKYNTYDL